MPTLWEIWTGQAKKKPLETQYCNPLDIRLGNAVRIDNVDLSNVPFTIDNFREVKRDINGEQHFFVDYNIVGSLYGQEKVSRRLRLQPKENAESTKIEDYDVILFNKFSECQYDEEFHKSLATQQELVEQDATYWRVNDNPNQQDAITHVINAKAIKNYDVDKNWLPSDQKLTYWDFWRETEGEGDTKVIEFYMIEMDKDGFFEFWTGRMIDPNRVSII